MTDGLHGPDHADTYPPGSAGTDRIGQVDSVEKAEPEPSMRSSEPLNASYVGGDGMDVDGMPRKRRTFTSKFGDDDAEASRDSSDDPKGVADKQKFTAVGQFKATVLNSWINVLLLAAPVGSMFPDGLVFEGIVANRCLSCAALCSRRSGGYLRGQLCCHHSTGSDAQLCDGGNCPAVCAINLACFRHN